MKDPSQVLQSAYDSTLTGAVTVNSTAVPVYDRVPSGAQFPYIKLGGKDVRDVSDKASFASEVYFDVIVVTGFTTTTDGKDQAYDISNQVMQLIRPLGSSGIIDLSPDFKALGISVEKTEDTEEDLGTHYEIRRLLKFKNLIQQL